MVPGQGRLRRKPAAWECGGLSRARRRALPRLAAQGHPAGEVTIDGGRVTRFRWPD